MTLDSIETPFAETPFSWFLRTEGFAAKTFCKCLFSKGVFARLTSRCDSAGSCGFGLQTVSQFLWAFSPIGAGKETPFLNRVLCAGGTGKKKPPCTGKTTPLVGRDLFWHQTRWKTNTFGDARPFLRCQLHWRQSTFGDVRPFPGKPRNLAEKSPALAKKTPSPRLKREGYNTPTACALRNINYHPGRNNYKRIP